MRSMCMVGGLLTLVAGAAALSTSGCLVDYVGGCEGTRTCDPTEPFGHEGSAGDAGEGGAGGQGGAGGSGGGGLDSCVPREDGASVPVGCGVFVSQAVDDKDLANKDPSKRKLFKTFGAALAFLASEEYVGLNRPPNLYACAEEFEEVVEVHEGTAIYGGLDCSHDWQWKADGRTMLASPEDTVPLTIFGGSERVHVERMTITAENAKILGGSSIAMRAQNGLVELSRCELRAGDGAPGGSPMPMLAVATDPSANGSNGEDAKVLSVMGKTVGGIGGNTAQGSQGCSPGGKGGDGDWDDGTDGEAATDGGGAGKGATNKNLYTCAPGSDGPEALKAGASGHGALDSDHGNILSEFANADGPYNYTNASGKSGGPGSNGRGGGGGGAGNGYGMSPTWYHGGAGGGGGAGGCGGKGGAPGGGGGSSIGVLSVNIHLDLSDVTIHTNSGGVGGNGAAGQDGGEGGQGGTGGIALPDTAIHAGCAGGKGSEGGSGGGGGGGRGGHSIGILSQLSQITGQDPLVMLGVSGAGGKGGGQATSGAAGISAPVKDLP